MIKHPLLQNIRGEVVTVIRSSPRFCPEFPAVFICFRPGLPASPACAWAGRVDVSGTATEGVAGQVAERVAGEDWIKGGRWRWEMGRVVATQVGKLPLIVGK